MDRQAKAVADAAAARARASINASLAAKKAVADAKKTAADTAKALAAKNAADAAKAGQVPGTPPRIIPQAHNNAEGPFPSRLWGADVATWQHPGGVPMDWAALANVKTGAVFAFVKVSEGLTYTNTSGLADRAALKSQKTLYGGYHYAIPSKPVVVSALAQAKFAFTQTGKLTAGELPLALDLEVNPNGLSPEELAAWTLTWLKETARLSGRTPILYTYPAFFNSQVAPVPELAGYPLWIANYGKALKSPSVPAPWTTWTFWQYASQGQDLLGMVTGTRLDLNVFAGTLPQLRALAGIVPKAPVVSPPRNVLAGADLMGDALLQALTAPEATSSETVTPELTPAVVAARAPAGRATS